MTQKHALLCLHPAKLFLNVGHFAALTRTTTLGRSCFTERGAPSEACIGVNIGGG